MKRNINLDFAKGIACIGVIIMHSGFPGTIGKLIGYLFKFAVPVFFMISGYYLYKDNINKNEKLATLLRKAKKIFKLLLVSELIYLVIYLIKIFFGYADFNSLYFSVKDILINIFTGTFFNGTLWFLYAMLYAYFILFIMEKFDLNKPNKNYVIIAFTILFIHIILRIILKKYNFYDIRLFRSALLYGLPFMMIGYFKKNNNIFNNRNIKITLIMFFAGYFISGGQYLVFKQSLDQDFGSILSSLALFTYFINPYNKTISKIISYIGERLSLYVYIIHLAIIDFISIALNKGLLLWLKPIVSVLVTVLVSFAIYKFKLKKNIIN